MFPNPHHVQRLLQPQLKSQLVACRRQTKAILHAISPIQWLPNELLAEIFYHCLPDNYHFSRHVAPLLICRVCRLWRALTLSNCGLWTRISFWSPPSSKRDLCYPPYLVNQWLSHSGSLPLRLYFDHGMLRSHLKIYVELVLLEHYPRCQYLELSVSALSARGMQSVIDLPPGSFGALESVVLDGLDEAHFVFLDDDDVLFPITAFQLSPRLKKLTTSFLEFTHHLTTSGTVFHPYVLPWAQLTHLLITEYVQVEIFVAALAECVDIQFLRVSLGLMGGNQEFINATPVDPPVKVVLPNLTALFVSLDGGSAFPPELDIFSFPALVGVHIRRHRDDAKEKDEFSWTQSSHFCGQLSHLQQLSLTGHVGSGEQVITLLESTLGLVKLSLDIFVDYQILLPALFPYNTLSPIQHVQDLEVHLECGELVFPLFPPNSILHDIQEGFPHTHMRHITDNSLQSCPCRFRDLAESTNQLRHLRILRVFVLQGPSCEKVLHELHEQFLSSSLQTYFESKDDSSRGYSDQTLIKTNMISYTLH